MIEDSILKALEIMNHTKCDLVKIDNTFYLKRFGGKILIINKPERVNIKSDTVVFKYIDQNNKEAVTHVDTTTWREISKQIHG